ncbi:MAG: flagellar hook-length control protein FliK [Marinobacter sp.]|nr:flagellar hook-length control protein FliK [Marinobacter sp.]
MPASVLPNLPMPDNAGAKGDSARTAAPPKTGDSEFDAVSRRQQEQLERDRKADHQARTDDQADARTDKADTDPADRARSDRDDPAARTEARADSPQDTRDPKTESASSETEPTTDKSSDSDHKSKDGKDSVAGFTFADLQALIAQNTGANEAVGGMDTGKAPKAAGVQFTTGTLAGAGTGAAPAGNTGGISAFLGSLVPGKTDATGLGSGKTSLAKAALIDGLVGQMAADGDKLTDLTQATASRFQGTLDQLSQNGVNQLNQAKPADGAVPLRSYATSIELPVGHAQWGEQLVGKLAWLTTRNMQSAEIHLTPPDLGPMEVKVHVHNDQASVTVHSASPVVRDHLEVNSHRLRDLLSDNGLSLAHFDVSDSSGQSSQGQGDDTAGGSGSQGGLLASGGDPGDGAELGAGTLDLTWRGEVDLYA